jgi:hypothetical protein
MRIVQVKSWSIPGMSYQENHLPSEQVELGHEVVLITSDRAPVFRGYERHLGVVVGRGVLGSGVFKEKGTYSTSMILMRKWERASQSEYYE